MPGGSNGSGAVSMQNNCDGDIHSHVDSKVIVANKSSSCPTGILPPGLKCRFGIILMEDTQRAAAEIELNNTGRNY